MKDDTKKRLDEHFQKLEDEARALKAAQEARAKREEDGLVRFLDLARNMIAPALTQMMEYLETKGMKGEVHIRVPKDGERGVTTHFAVEAIFPNSMKPGNNEPPHFRLTYNKPDQVVSLFLRTNEYNLPGERHTLDEVTIEWLEEEFTKYIVKGI